MTRPMTTEELFASSGGAKIYFNKYSRPGDSVEGTVISTQVQQARDFDTNELLWWDEEKTQPRNNFIATLATNLRDPNVEDDNGDRRVFVRWQGTSKSNLISAVNKGGDKFVRDGSYLKVTYLGEGEKTGRLNPPKIYDFVYKAPPSDVERLMSEPAEPERPAATVTNIVRQAGTPVQHTVTQAQPSAAPPVADEQPDLIKIATQTMNDRKAAIDKVQKLIAAGFSDAEIADMVGSLDIKAVIAIRNL